LNAKLPLLINMVAQDKMHVNIQLHLKGIRISAPSICDICDCHVFHQYTLRIVDGDRDGLMKLVKQRYSMCYLLSNSIALTKAYLDARYKEEDFPVTNQLVKSVSLPMHTG
jgi:hypothetical protein